MNSNFAEAFCKSVDRAVEARVTTLMAALTKGHWEHGFKGEDGEWKWFDTDPDHVDDLLFTSDPETEWQQRYVIELSKAEAKDLGL